MQKFPVVFDLPLSYLQAIGRVCVWWAWQERLLSNIVYMLLGIGPKHGRIAVRSPRADEQITLIRQLMGLENVTSSELELTKLANSLRAIQKLRDLVAHGIWLKNTETGEIMIQDISGNWKPDPRTPKIAKRIKPEGVVIAEGDIDKITDLLRETLRSTEILYQEIKAQLPSSRSKPLE